MKSRTDTEILSLINFYNCLSANKLILLYSFFAEKSLDDSLSDIDKLKFSFRYMIIALELADRYIKERK